MMLLKMRMRMKMMLMKPVIYLIKGKGGGNGGGGSRVFCKQRQLKQKKQQKKRKAGKQIKVIRVPDGVVSIYKNVIKAGEVMKEYPKHKVCRSDTLYIGHIIPHLSQQDKLLMGHTYFLLPSHLFHSVLSFLTIATSFSPTSHPHSSPQPLPPKAFDIHKTTSGTLRIRVSDLFISHLLIKQPPHNNNDNDYDHDDVQKQHDHLLCTTPQLHKDYQQLVIRSRVVGQWKPKLDIIHEKHRHQRHHNNKMMISKYLLTSPNSLISILNTKRICSTTNPTTITTNSPYTTKLSHQTTTTMPRPAATAIVSPQLQMQLQSQSSTLSSPPTIKSQSTCKLRQFKLKLPVRSSH